MILYKFLNGDKTASAKYITDAFYDVNELKSLRQFYVTELREVSPEIVQAGINIEVGMYNEVDFINMAKIAQLTLEKWSDNTFLGTLVSVPEDKNMGITSPNGPIEYGDDIDFEWDAVDGATDYSVYVVEATKDFIPNEFNKTTSNQLSIALATGVKYKWMVVANIGNSSMVIVPSREFTVA